MSKAALGGRFSFFEGLPDMNGYSVGASTRAERHGDPYVTRAAWPRWPGSAPGLTLRPTR